jgi:cell division transport system permease protein
MRLKNYLLNHAYALVYSLGQISRTPLSGMMTVMVIGITLALPTVLYVALQNTQQLTAGLDNVAQISLFLKKDAREQSATDLAGQLRRNPDIATVEVITPDQALEEFRHSAGFADALRALEENPLPFVLVIKPVTAHPDTVARLQATLQKFPEADFAQLDMQWVQRLYAALGVAQQGVMILAGLLGVGVLLIVGNTIRLGIHSNRDEITITKLMGATDAFVRRPFLYAGIWYGMLGGLLAWLLVSVALVLLAEPVARLSALYGSRFVLGGLDVSGALILLLGATLLGLLGSWLAVGRHLRAVEPV